MLLEEGIFTMQTSSIIRFPRRLFKLLARISRLFATAFAGAGLILFLGVDAINAGQFDSLIFAGALTIACLFEAYLILAPYLESRLEHKTDYDSEAQNELLFIPTNPIYLHRSRIRVILLSSVAAACGLLIIRLLRAGSDAANTHLAFVVAAVMFYFFGITFLARIQHIVIRNFIIGSNWIIWSALSVIVGITLSYGLYASEITRSPFLLLGAIFVGTGVSWIVYVDNRLGISDKVWSEVVQDLSMNLMKVGALRSHRDYVVEVIGNRLRYERVFLLEPTSDRRELRVTAEFGDYPPVKGSSFPLDRGITGHVFSTGKASGWNDVSRCPYYYQLIPEEKDTTRSEIAVPIQYRGEMYGVLDIQSRHSIVYAPSDIRSLETIANILGMSMAIDNSDILLEEANSLWDRLSESELVEEEAFKLIADFGRNKLGADLVIYYQLSPTGYPIKPPDVVGKLIEPDWMTNPVSDLSSPLVKLIDFWNPRFESKITTNSIFLHQGSPEPPSFAAREKIQSVCFIPIGTKNERLGIVFLNYRHPHAFDSIYQLTVMAFAQAFATLASRARYRQIVFEGFGRPDLGVHNIQARYGLKEGIVREGRRIFAASCRPLFQAIGEIDDCGMFKVLHNVDDFLSEIRAQTTVEFDIWNRTLREAFLDYTRRMKEQALNRHIWFITDLDARVERESPWTRLALYRILTEAVNNAVFHGRATEVDILVQRREKSVYLRVINDGQPLPEGAQRNRSRGGIFGLLEELKAQFNAQYSIGIHEAKGGTIIEAEIPALPLQPEVNRV